MKISKENFKNYALTGINQVISEKTILLFASMILFHGFLFCLIYKFLACKSIIFPIFFTFVLLLTYFLTYKYAVKQAGAITNGYNYLMLSLFGFINSLICLLTSIVVYYYKLHSIKDIVTMLITFFVAVALFYLLVFYKISKFKPISNTANTKTNNTVGKTPAIVALILPVVLSLSKIIQQADQSTIGLFLSVLFYLIAILYAFITSLIIKFICLKSIK